MDLTTKEAKVCNLLNKYVDKKVKELMDKCDSNWLIHDKVTFKIPKMHTTDDNRQVIIFVDTEIKNILFRDDEIYYTPKYIKQSNVKRFIERINEECDNILRQYNKYESLVDSNINMLEVLLEI